MIKLDDNLKLILLISSLKPMLWVLIRFASVIASQRQF